MKYILGIDSGGTKFLVRARALDGSLLGEYTGLPCRHDEIGEEETLHRAEQNIASCLSLFDGKRADCVQIAAGISGIDSDEDAAIIDRIYHSLAGFSCPITCLNDAELTHYTVTGGVGALVIAGTGSIAFGKNASGESCRVGGWIFSILSEEGSGSYITRRALHHFSRWMDECVEETELVRLTKKRLGISTRKQLMDFATQIATPPWELPSLSIEVNEAAAAGDPYAHAILTDAASCTFGLADAVVQKLHLYKEEQFKVGVWGSAIVKSKIHLGEFRRLFCEKYSNVKIVVPTEDAAEGACRLALSLSQKNPFQA